MRAFQGRHFDQWRRTVYLHRTRVVAVGLKSHEEDDPTQTVCIKGAIVQPFGGTSSSLTPEGERERAEYLMVSTPEIEVRESDRVVDDAGATYQVIGVRAWGTHYETRLRRH